MRSVILTIVPEQSPVAGWRRFKLWLQACVACAVTAIISAFRGTPSMGSATAGRVSRLFWKHWRQRTGRPCVGLKGTVVSIPQSEQTVRVSVREIPAAAGPEPGRAEAPARLDLQGLHRLGSFLNCLSKKKSCSPAVKMNSPPQSAQVNILSTNSIAASPDLPGRVTTPWKSCRLPERSPCRDDGT